MKCEPTCPRCGRQLREPGLWSSEWECEAHGAVSPLRGVLPPGDEGLEILLARTRVPVWIPWPLPAGWVVTGFSCAGDDRTGAVASVVALSGPAPLGGVGELAIVAEEPGVGLGARLAGADGPDPGPQFDAGPAEGKLRFDGHDVAVWHVAAKEDRAAFAGEALGRWVWFVLSPADAGTFMYELTSLRDLRDLGDGGVELHPPFGALSPFISAQLAPR
ncbi:hypothetical protein J4H86_10265 [Spiractinospora alimapuensis]|uniref:DUF6758 family protein n=1 Tax=Spiractinospora alimapuensis TaxID=2820884 RepID=UPI001F2056D5|nr:DUF6758 family protein [Spiractinospora alimapuensis]QVQ54044.1 hypothetical protein J4H86_10265 [Spiractinospora alimapuensis]